MTYWWAVALGGSLGALGRYAMALALPHAPGKLPATTLAVNFLGSFLMGLCFVIIVERGLLPPLWRQAVLVGFLGAFTTFSTFSMEAFQLFYTGHWKVAISYAVLSTLGCIFAAFFGYSLINKIF